jgi:signal transduction histidine kinase
VLLVLIFLPGLATRHRTERSYQEIHAMQAAQERKQRAFDGIGSNLYMVSILVREFLLDTSPTNAGTYRSRLEQYRARVSENLETLAGMAQPGDRGGFATLRAELEAYWRAMEPVFNWTPRERRERGTYFLREQQRPRREAILAITDRIARLSGNDYRQQYSQIDRTYRTLRTDVDRVLAGALLLGILVAGGSALRIYFLERDSARERRATEEAREQLQGLSARLVRAQEEERRSLSRELHDEVGQTLTALRMELGGLKAGPRDGHGFEARLQELETLIERTLRTVRDLAMGLRPSMLDDLGLAPAVEWQARQFGRRSGTRVSVEISGDLDNVPDECATCAYRIIQEALTNCARHSQARQIRVGLQGLPGSVVVTVQDDGAGFDAERAAGGLGLLGIRERVRDIGGTVAVLSRPGEGTLLKAALPLRREGQ